VADHFARLGVQRSPWLDPEELKRRFLTLSAEAHPDKAGADKRGAESDFQAVNDAYNTLRAMRPRLLHLLELEGAPKASHVEELPTAAVELFTPIAEITKRADSLLKQKAAANSPMLKVQLFQKALECVEAIQQTQQDLQARISHIETDLRDLGPNWKGSLPRLQQAATALGFFDRWNAQLQERAAALTF
jgi:curved DNA-binding protein CbpA